MHFLGQFRVQLEVLALVKIHPVETYFPEKNSCSTIKLFSFIKYVLYQTVLSKYTPAKIGGHRARLREKDNLFCYRGKSLTFWTCTRSCVRANDVGMCNAILHLEFLQKQFTMDIPMKHCCSCLIYYIKENNDESFETLNCYLEMAGLKWRSRTAP